MSMLASLEACERCWDRPCTCEPDIYDAVAEYRERHPELMKPTTPLDTEMVFLRDIDARLKRIEFDKATGNTIKSWNIAGIRNALNARIATVTKLRDEENTHAIEKDIRA